MACHNFPCLARVGPMNFHYSKKSHRLCHSSEGIQYIEESIEKWPNIVKACPGIHSFEHYAMFGSSRAIELLYA